MDRSKNDESNILALDKRYTIKRIDGFSETRKFKICKPCHEILKSGK